MNDSVKKKKNRASIIKALITVGLIVGAVVYLVTSSFNETMIYYKTVEEVLTNRANFESQPVRVNGLLVHDSILNKPGTDQFVFKLEKNGKVLVVEYAGILPDNMKEGKELIVQGTLVPGEDTMEATEILTKCPSKYEKEAQNRNQK